MATDLFAKYDVAVPRYTSYPTVPQWQETIADWEREWRELQDIWLPAL